MRTLSLFTFSLILAACYVGSTNAQTVLFSDSFNRLTGASDANLEIPDPNGINSDWGDNDNAFGGTLVDTWSIGPNRGGGCNGSTDGDLATLCNGSARYPVDITSLAPSGFTVEFQFGRFHPVNPGTGNGFVSIGFGTDPNAEQGGGLFNFNNSDFNLVFQQGAGTNVGNTQLIEDSVLIDPLVDGDPGPVDYGDPTIEHSVELTLVPAVNGQYGDTDVINGTFTVDSDPNKSHNFSVFGGDFFGNISFATNGFVHRYIDDVTVTALPVTASPDANGDGRVDAEDFLILQRTDPSLIPLWESSYPSPIVGAVAAVPEPGSLCLLLVGLSVCVIRNRKL